MEAYDSFFMNRKFQKKPDNQSIDSSDNIFKSRGFKKNKKEILSITKQIIKGKIDNESLREGYITYVNQVMDYIKFSEQMRLIQAEYDGMVDVSMNENESDIKELDLDATNKLMFKEADKKIVLIENFVKKKNNIVKEVHKFPTKKIHD